MNIFEKTVRMIRMIGRKEFEEMMQEINDSPIKYAHYYVLNSTSYEVMEYIKNVPEYTNSLSRLLHR